MAIIAGIVFVIIGLVALVFLLSFASESIADITEDTKEAIDQAKVDFKGNCNLHITFFGEIDSILFSIPTALDFRFGSNTQHPEIAQWRFNCNPGGLDFTNLDMIQGLSFFTIGEERNTMRLKIIASDGSFRTCERYPTLCKDVVIPANKLINTPFAFQKTFLISDIPCKDYNIEVSIEAQKINLAPSGAPFIYSVVTNAGSCT